MGAVIHSGGAMVFVVTFIPLGSEIPVAWWMGDDDEGLWGFGVVEGRGQVGGEGWGEDGVEGIGGHGSDAGDGGGDGGYGDWIYTILHSGKRVGR